MRTKTLPILLMIGAVFCFASMDATAKYLMKQIGPAAGVVWGAYKTLKDISWIKPDESVVLFATGIERCKL